MNAGDLFDLAFDRAYKKLVKMHDEGYVPLSKKNMRIVAKETAAQVRQESIAILGHDLQNYMIDFEKDMINRLDEWGQAPAMATGRDEALPEGCKFATTKGNTATFIIEQKPQVRTILGGGHGGEKNGTHSLAMPYMIFGLHFVDGRYANCTINVRNESLVSLDDELKQAYISNIYKAPDSLGLCMAPIGLQRNTSLNTQCKSIIGDFWQSEFHGGQPHNHANCPDDRLRTWETWEKATKEDPSFILKVNWPKIAKEDSYTVKKLIDRIRKTGDLANYYNRPGRDKEVQVQNFFRRQAQVLYQRVQKAVMGIVIEDYEPEVDPEFVPVVQERPEPVPIEEERDNQAALEMAKQAALRMKEENAEQKRAKIARRGEKQCPECFEIVRHNTIECECGWNFDIARKLPPAKMPLQAMPQPQRQARQRPQRVAPPPAPVKIPKAVEDKIKNLVGRGAEIAKKAKAVRPGKGKKACERCNQIVGAKTRFCPCGFQFY